MNNEIFEEYVSPNYSLKKSSLNPIIYEDYQVNEMWIIWQDARLDLIENAQYVMQDTAPSWKHRCLQMCSLLNLDYGDGNDVFPDELRYVEMLEQENRMLKLYIEENK